MSPRCFLPNAIIALSVALTAPTAAQASARNMAVATRALAFLEPKLSGTISIAVVHAAGSSASEADARDIARALSDTKLKGVSFQPKLVSSANLAGIADAKVVFLASGVSNQLAIFSAASKVKAVTLSFDMACVNAGRCVIGVRTAPKVEIVVSRAARQASGVAFSQAFLMLVTEQ